MWDEEFMSSFSLNSDSPTQNWERIGEGLYTCVINEFSPGLFCLVQTQPTWWINDTILGRHADKNTGNGGEYSPPSFQQGCTWHSGFMLLYKETYANQLFLPRKLHQDHFLHLSTEKPDHEQRWNIQELLVKGKQVLITSWRNKKLFRIVGILYSNSVTT